jgi:hypothetical protein
VDGFVGPKKGQGRGPTNRGVSKKRKVAVVAVPPLWRQIISSQYGHAFRGVGSSATGSDKLTNGQTKLAIL